MSEQLEQSLREAAQADARSVEAKRPEQAAQALMMLCDGMSERAVERGTGISARCVSTMKKRHAEFLQVGRAEAARRAARLASKAESVALQKLRLLDPEEAVDKADRAEREETLKKLNPRDVLVTYGVACDKSRQLEPAPMVVADYSNVPSLDRVREVLAQVRADAAARREDEERAKESEIDKRVSERLREIEGAENVIEIGGGTESKAGRSKGGVRGA